jgi:hypothetical protein
MPHVLYLECRPCSRTAKLPYRDAWEAMGRERLLRQFRCSRCGGRPSDVRRAWYVDGTELLRGHPGAK